MVWSTCSATTGASIILMVDIGSNSNSNVSKRAMSSLFGLFLDLSCAGWNQLIGFDKLHQVPAKGVDFKKTPKHYDHWHRRFQEIL